MLVRQSLLELLGYWELCIEGGYGQTRLDIKMEALPAPPPQWTASRTFEFQVLVVSLAPSLPRNPKPSWMLEDTESMLFEAVQPLPPCQAPCPHRVLESP